MPRARVLSFMSQWGGSGSQTPKTPSASAPNSPPKSPIPRSETPTTYGPGTPVDSPSRDSPKPPRTDSEKRHSRRTSMIMAYQPPTMEIAKDTPPELQPIFTHLNTHTNKLYQEGYFLKLHDLDSRGRPSNDRVWTECFAQLVGTVLSLWDAAHLDAAGEDGEVMPTFINMTDASIKMIESLPMNGLDGQSLQNVLSISTAANNRYLLHFNSLHSLTQWTAGIRLAMYEHSTLQEAYTGSIIAGKGKYLNSIKSIMERARYPMEDWARVRFGAGTPWRRCWCVISPPDDKEVHKAQKMAKKRSAYEKSPVVKGEIKFYETRKVTKKTKPIATVRDAYTAYAIYPQSKPLIDQSTLVKVDGRITIHSSPEHTTEGFVFVMPEVHPAITGFEIMLRWLMPTFDTFALYGRPSRLIADVMDVRSLMFGMPSGSRYGHLDLIDVAGLIHTEGSNDWSEREWRKQLKNMTSKRMNAPQAPNRTVSSDDSYRGGSRSSGNLPLTNGRIAFNLTPQQNGDALPSNGVARSSPNSRGGSPSRNSPVFSQPQRNASDTALSQPPPRFHQKAMSSDNYRPTHGSRLSFETAKRNGSPPAPPPHQNGRPGPPPPQHWVPASSQFDTRTEEYHDAFDVREIYAEPNSSRLSRDDFPSAESYHDGHHTPDSPQLDQHVQGPPPPPTIDEPLRPVAAPPSMAHKPNAQPPRRPGQMPDIRRANSAIDAATLAQLKDANPGGASYAQGQPVMPPREEGQWHQAPQMGMQMPPPSGMRRPGAPSQMLNLPDRRLPTIPGTPAGEVDRFDLGHSRDDVHAGNGPATLQRGVSSGSIQRKPVPGRN